MSKKTYHYRIYPTKKQATILASWLNLCCETYNAALQERRDAYRLAGRSISYSHQCSELPACKEVRPELAEVHSQVLQDALKRVDLAFEAFYRRLAAGEKPGYPRFRSRFRYASLTFKQYENSFSLASDGKLVLSKLGHVKMVQHRPLRGTPKTAIVKRTPTGKWFVSITCEEVEQVPLPPSQEQVGLDVGLKTFAYLSDGSRIEIPAFLGKQSKPWRRRNASSPKQRKAAKNESKHTMWWRVCMSASSIAVRTSFTKQPVSWSIALG